METIIEIYGAKIEAWKQKQRTMALRSCQIIETCDMKQLLEHVALREPVANKSKGLSK